MITVTKREKKRRESVKIRGYIRTKLFPSAFCSSLSFSLSLFSFSRNILAFLALLANRKVRELFFTDMHVFQCGALSWIREKSNGYRKIFNNDDDLDKGRSRFFFLEICSWFENLCTLTWWREVCKCILHMFRL